MSSALEVAGALLIAGSGIALILNRAKTAAKFFMLGVAAAIVSALLTPDPIQGEVAIILQWAIASPVAIFIVVAATLLLIGAIVRLLSAFWGPELAANVLGVYVVRLVDAVFAAPFLLISALTRLLRKRRS